MYMNRQTGELMTYKEMQREGVEQYDLNDPTNIFTFDDYYVKVSDAVMAAIDEGRL